MPSEDATPTPLISDRPFPRHRVMASIVLGLLITAGIGHAVAGAHAWLESHPARAALLEAKLPEPAPPITPPGQSR